jgi:hypothetical protein
MLTRLTRWFLIAAPLVAGVLLLILGTAGAISTAFGVTLIGIAAIVWMWNWFIRMSFNDRAREHETRDREERASEGQRLREQRADDERRARERSARAQRETAERASRPGSPAEPHRLARKPVRRPRRPS